MLERTVTSASYFRWGLRARRSEPSLSGKEMTETWLRTDDREDAIASLKLFVDAVFLIKDDMAYWKLSFLSGGRIEKEAKENESR